MKMYLFLFIFLIPSLLDSQPTNSIFPPAPAPAPAPAPTTPDPTQLNLTRILSTCGCSAFAQSLANSTAQTAFNDVVEGGLTVFCPNDAVWALFSPKFKTLNPPSKTSLLEFHGVPIYMPLPVLMSSNGVTNTLATNGAAEFDFTVQNGGQDVTISTSLVTANVDVAAFDEPPLVVFLIDKVLEPDELFASHAPPPTPSGKVKGGGSDVDSSPPSAESPDDSLADRDGDGDGNSAVRVYGGAAYVALTVWMGFLPL